jgi:hypothetical protein
VYKVSHSVECGAFNSNVERTLLSSLLASLMKNYGKSTKQSSKTLFQNRSCYARLLYNVHMEKRALESESEDAKF